MQLSGHATAPGFGEVEADVLPRGKPRAASRLTESQLQLLPSGAQLVDRKNLEENGCGKFLRRRFRHNWIELYKRFLASENFKSWFSRRRAAAERAQNRVWRRARAKTDIHPFLPLLSEVQLVDAFTTVEQQLQAELALSGGELGGSSGDSRHSHTAAVIKKFRGDLWAIYDKLPRDVQQTLSFTPHLAALMQGQMRYPARPPGHLHLDVAKLDVQLEHDLQVSPEKEKGTLNWSWPRRSPLSSMLQQARESVAVANEGKEGKLPDRMREGMQ
ncbi:hypothetical protein CYMTET_52482 [Cymbomonas tetramitiformis]|uniref:Uncharacterized protein n=1 Tax=Cymbomonas tetramitiformis TaxID=36881 RepID=A0AAE0EQR8_9CHLO|nr:hypothetical protein CYMTET_52482 [Cymbomonas tetramitiformis]